MGDGEAEGSGPASLGTGLAAQQHTLDMLIDYCLSPQRAMELYFCPNSQAVSVEAGSGAIIMRQILSCLLLAAVWLGSLASVIWFLNIGGYTLMLLGSGIIIVATALAVAEESNEWRRRHHRVQRQSPAA